MKTVELHQKLNVLKPNTNVKLIRLGDKNDGGYVISEDAIYRSKYLVSGGYGHDATFEIDALLNCKNLIEVHLFDYSINLFTIIKGILLHSPKNFLLFLVDRVRGRKYLKILPNFGYLFNFIKLKKVSNLYYLNYKIVNEKVSNLESKSISLLKYIESRDFESVFIKLDIEESEYEIIEELLSIYSKINGFVIEFHEIKKNSKVFIEIINKMKIYFEICHLHINNFRPEVDSGWPNTVEISFINKKLCGPKSENDDFKFYYSHLDRPNNMYDEELAILFSE